MPSSCLIHAPFLPSRTLADHHLHHHLLFSPSSSSPFHLHYHHLFLIILSPPPSYSSSSSPHPHRYPHHCPPILIFTITIIHVIISSHSYPHLHHDLNHSSSSSPLSPFITIISSSPRHPTFITITGLLIPSSSSPLFSSSPLS